MNDNHGVRLYNPMYTLDSESNEGDEGSPLSPRSPHLMADARRAAIKSVSASRFETPLRPVSVSGGTAAFFSVKYRAGMEHTDPSPMDGKPVGSSDYWIGKDYSRAEDEIDFYETAKEYQVPFALSPTYIACACCVGASAW